VGRTSHTRRTGQARHRHWPDQRGQVYDAKERAAVARLEDFPAQSCGWYRGFTDVSTPAVTPPTDPVSATIVFVASSLSSPITSLSSIDLTIDGHDYQLPELAVGQLSGGLNAEIWGIVNDKSIYSSTNDIDLILNYPASGGPSFFMYSSSNYPYDIWYTEHFDSYLVVASTPLPATLPLFATGLGLLSLLGWFGKRERSGAIKGQWPL
jgi:hypothetical protein